MTFVYNFVEKHKLTWDSEENFDLIRACDLLNFKLLRIVCLSVVANHFWAGKTKEDDM